MASLITQRIETAADVRCACGALLFKALGPTALEMKCRRCRRICRFYSGHEADIILHNETLRPEPREGRSPDKRGSHEIMQRLPASRTVPGAV
jgi:phage FluMu protein Com